MKPIAYKSESAFTGVAIYSIEYGIEDYVKAAYTGKNARKCKIRHDRTGNAYFVLNGAKQYIDEFMQV